MSKYKHYCEYSSNKEERFKLTCNALYSSNKEERFKLNWTAKYYTSRKVKSNSKVNSCYGMNVGAAVAMKGIDRGCTA